MATASSSVVVGDEREDRPEDLLLGDGHRVVDVGEQRRLDVPALVEAGRPTAADDEGGALGHAGGDVALDPVALALGHERAALGLGVERIADLVVGHGLGQGVAHLGVAGAAARMRVWATQAWPLFMMAAGSRPGIDRRRGRRRRR